MASKISDLEIPTFIIPIKPYWASQLFDSISSDGSLFGANPNLIWNRENVYYRSVNPNTETFPARILWYSSTQKGYYRQQQIFACSYLTDIKIAEAKFLYSKFKRFGIYSWKEIYKLAKDDSKRPIKVLKFCNTEIFAQGLDFRSINKILLLNGMKRNTFMSPVKLKMNAFPHIYQKLK
ncbi:MAG TPA: hypothetical protein PLJ60_04440 [Chryseolinea sp.]|nr:hypothetical protein [Chryseolinea sp.]HPM29565.1 hypothetical protein [Chryseolinea sp.]